VKLKKAAGRHAHLGATNRTAALLISLVAARSPVGDAIPIHAQHCALLLGFPKVNHFASAK